MGCSARPRGGIRARAARGGKQDRGGGEGRSEGAGGPPKAAGWHAGTRLRQLSAIAFVAPGALVTSPAPATRRDRQPVTAALVAAADAVAGRATVSTRLPGHVRTLLVGLEPAPDVDDDLEGLVLGLEGAARDVVEPRTVVAGPRTYRVFGLKPDPEGPAVVATVASDERWTLAAVIGSTAAPDVLAGDLPRPRGAARLGRPLAARGERGEVARESGGER